MRGPLRLDGTIAAMSDSIWGATRRGRLWTEHACIHRLAKLKPMRWAIPVKNHLRQARGLQSENRGRIAYEAFQRKFQFGNITPGHAEEPRIVATRLAPITIFQAGRRRSKCSAPGRRQGLHLPSTSPVNWISNKSLVFG